MSVILAFFNVREAEAGKVVALFPPDLAGKARAAWSIDYEYFPSFQKGPTDAPQYLAITGATYTTRTENGLFADYPILDDARIAEIYVLYNEGDAKRPSAQLYDLTNGQGLIELISGSPTPDENADMPGAIKGIVEEIAPKKYQLVKSAELAYPENGRIYGRTEYLHGDIRWVSGNSRPSYKYGHKLVIWSLLAADNYLYIVRYVFFDDGSIHLQAGATGQNYHDRPSSEAKLSAFTHAHLATWRLAFALAEPDDRNSLWRVENDHDGTRGSLIRKPINYEAAININSDRYQRINVRGLVKNNAGAVDPISYDVIPVGIGRLRFDPSLNHFAGNDIWATAKERILGGPANVAMLPKLINSVPEALDQRGFDIWCNSSFLHTPRQEDFTAQGMKAVATTTWSTIYLIPRDLSYSSPFY